MRGYVLCGGLSSRFGSDKALFKVEGMPLVLRVAQVLAEAGLEPWLISREPRGLGIPEVLDGVGGERHPLLGIAAGLATVEIALFCPCDVGVTGEQVRRLMQAAEAACVYQNPKAFPGVSARGQPLLAVLPCRLQMLAREIAGQGGPVRRLLDGVLEVDLGELPNWNRPPTAAQTGTPPASPSGDPARSGNPFR